MQAEVSVSTVLVPMTKIWITKLTIVAWFCSSKSKNSLQDSHEAFTLASLSQLTKSGKREMPTSVNQDN